MNRKKYRLAAAAVSALAIGLLGTGAPAAFAADPPPVSAAVINATAPVTLSIHKYLGTPTGQANNGTELTVTGLSPLQGAPFDVYKVTQWLDTADTSGGASGTWKAVDLTSNAGWTQAAAIQGCMPTQAEISALAMTCNTVQYKLASMGTATTIADGTASISPTGGVGLYLVNENLAGATLMSGTTSILPSTVTPAAPFFVTLPMTNPVDKSSWMYNVHVYPKNQNDSISKTVQDAATVEVGSPIQYTMQSTIPGITPLGFYYIQDFNANVNATGVVLTIEVPGTTPQSIGLTGCAATVTVPATCDYVYWLDSDSTAAGSQLKIAFTSDGLTKLQTYETGTVKTVVSGTVISVPTDGLLTNTANFIPSSTWYANNGGTGTLTPPSTSTTTPPTEPTPTGTPGIPSTPVVSKFGDVTITKTLVNPATGDTVVGAIFAIHQDPTPNDGICSATDINTGALLDTQEITTGTTATFSDLRASNWANGGLITASNASPYITYCVVETKAPTGYNLLANAVPVTITVTDGGTVAVPLTELSLANEKANLGNNLPLTGGEGIAALSLGGLALIGGGAGYYAYTSRKRRTA